jgi:hypothetical protein
MANSRVTQMANITEENINEDIHIGRPEGRE